MWYLEDINSHVNIDSLFDGISLKEEDGTVPGSSVWYSYGFSKNS